MNRVWIPWKISPITKSWGWFLTLINALGNSVETLSLLEMLVSIWDVIILSIEDVSITASSCKEISIDDLDRD